MKSKLFICILLFLLNIQVKANENELLPFTTDGCSMAPDNDFIIGDGDWTKCCVNHDKVYWLGGTYDQKEKADDEFNQCLKKEGMNSIEALVYYEAVSFGGTTYIDSTWKWGYGWKNSRGYDPLSKEDIEQAKSYLKLLKLPKKIVTPSPFLPLEKLFGSVTTKNFCKEDMINRIKKLTGIKDNKSFKIVRVDAKNGTDGFQVFSTQCRGGYFHVEFLASLAPDRCLVNNYFQQKNQIEKIEAIGKCEESLL